MALPIIKNRQQLLNHLALLEEREKFYRVRVERDVAELLMFVKDPASTIKRTVKSLAGDKDFRGDLLNVGLNYAMEFITGKLRDRAAKGGWLASLISKFRGKDS